MTNAKATTTGGAGSRGFIALLGAMSCGALNDNLLRGALLLAVAMGGGGMWEGALGEGGTGWVTFMLYAPLHRLLGHYRAVGRSLSASHDHHHLACIGSGAVADW